MRYRFSRHIQGFGLIETLFAITILGIVLALAIPSFVSLIQNNTISSLSTDMIASVNLARSEALKRNVPVSICAPNDNSFSACGSQWELGWMVFVNPTGGNTLNNTQNAPLIRTYRIDDPNISVSTAPTVNIITYSGNGFPAAGSANLSFTILSNKCTLDAGRQVSISSTGRPSYSPVTCP